MSNHVVNYAPAGPTIKAFHESDAFFRGIMGPIGSGKSSACAVEILRRAQLQWPGPDGIRRTRVAVIRNSYPELKTAVLKTWHQWCPNTFGKVNMDSPFIHHIQNENFDLEVLFLALDRDEDQRKLLSLELSFAWCNEAKELSKAVIDTLTGRVGRFPSKIQGGCRWHGIFADTNACDDQHWWYRFSEEETPEGWQFFKQRSGLSLGAENIENLPKDYYKNLLAGKDDDWVKVFVHSEYGMLVEGKPCFPMYRDSTHAAKEILEPNPAFGLLIGADFGLTPAAIIGQKLPDGRVLIVDELCTDNTGVQRFAEILREFLSKNYPEHNIAGCWADPAGNQRGQIDLKSAIEIMNEHTPWKWRPAPGDNSLTERLEAVRGTLNRMVDGHPGILISPKCKTLRKGFVSGYHYKLSKSGNGSVTSETPNKNEYSHPHDALQYLLLGSGEYGVVLNKVKKTGMSRPKSYLDNRSDRSIFDSRPRKKGIFD